MLSRRAIDPRTRLLRIAEIDGAAAMHLAARRANFRDRLVIGRCIYVATNDDRPARCEQQRRLSSLAAASARDQGDLAVKPMRSRFIQCHADFLSV